MSDSLLIQEIADLRAQLKKARGGNLATSARWCVHEAQTESECLLKELAEMRTRLAASEAENARLTRAVAFEKANTQESSDNGARWRWQCEQEVARRDEAIRKREEAERALVEARGKHLDDELQIGGLMNLVKEKERSIKEAMDAGYGQGVINTEAMVSGRISDLEAKLKNSEIARDAQLAYHKTMPGWTAGEPATIFMRRLARWYDDGLALPAQEKKSQEKSDGV